MTEIRINVELGMSPELQKFIASMFAHVANSTPVEAIAEPEHRKRKTANIAKDESAVEVAVEQADEQTEAAKEVAQAESAEPAIQAEPTKQIKMEDIRLKMKALWDADRNVVNGIMESFGASNLTKISEDKYPELYDAFCKELNERGL